VNARGRSQAQADPRERSRRSPADPESDQVPRLVSVAVLAAILVAAALIRLRLANLPLERDEGEYAYAGQLMLQGVPPYQLAYNMKFPGTYGAYAAIMALFGQTARGIHVGLLLVNAATTWLLYRLARRLAGERAALVAAAAFAVLSLDRWIMGVFAHATQFVILAVVAGLLLLERASASRRLGLFFAAGVLLGLAVLMKQHAVAFVAFALAILLWRDLKIDRTPLGAALWRSGALALGAAAPLAIVCALLVAQGVFGRFWLWTVRYASAYVSEVPLSGALPALVAGIHLVTIATWALWLVAGIGLAGLWLAPWRRETRVYVVGFLLAAFVTVCPGFYFRAHYFIAMLPAVALLVGVAIVSLERWAAKALGPAAAAAAAVALFLAAILSYVATERGYLFTMSPDDVSRERYGRNLFVEAPAIGRFIQARTAVGDRVAVIGSEPEIYFYANRHSATGYIYMYPLMEPQPFATRMQDELIREVEAAHPAMIVFVASRTSWAPRPGSDRRVLEWADRYLKQCYDVVGVTERLPDGTSESHWDAEAAGHQPRSGNVVYTLKRRSNTLCSVESSTPP
jgi:hypothetical protein